MDIPLFYDPKRIDRRLGRAFELLAVDWPIAPASAGEQVNLEASLGSDHPFFRHQSGRLSLGGKTVPQVLRALASWRGFAQTGAVPPEQTLTAHFTTMGLMVDASRHAVPNLPTLQQLLRYMALLGLNQLMLYTEDTYQVESQPYFGYLRGGYSADELRQLDDYADALGIEMVPCIQVLGHLGQMLQWPVFAPIRDTPNILLVDEPRTYEVIEAMIAAASAPYRSKRIHVGMDEAHELGQGRYREKHGSQPRFELMSRHLARVTDICRRSGLKPMIWSDMYFRLGSATGDYYDPAARIPVEIAKEIPAEADLVYWDYYHPEPTFYEEWIDRHRALGKEPIFAGGLWTWQVFWQNLSLTRVNTDAAMQACKTKGVREVMTTAWGDDGNEVEFFSMLPGLTHFAEHGYSSTIDETALRRQFAATCGMAWERWTFHGEIDETPGRMSLREAAGSGGVPITPASEHLADDRSVNWNAYDPSKYLLWQDPLLGLYDVHLDDIPLAQHFNGLAARLRAVHQDEGVFPIGQVIWRLAEVLSDKAELGLQIRRAYLQGDRDHLRRLAEDVLPRLIDNLRALHEAHRQAWHRSYKPFGWDTLDRRYGGLAARLETARRRLLEFLAGTIQRIDELDPPRLPVHPWPAGRLGNSGRYRRIVTASTVL